MKVCLLRVQPAILFVALLLPLMAHGEQSTRMPPSVPPVTQAYPLSSVPVMDGNVLDDAAWEGAKATSGFWQIQPREGRPATQETQVFVGYSEDTLYIGAVLYDENPAGIIVSDSRRDADLDETDSFQVILDTFLDRQNGFVFGTNPAGLQYDGQVTKEGGTQFGSGSGGGFNRDWDTTWEVATRIGDYGWSLEMAIPFRSLRYTSGGKEQDARIWGINFQRNIRRNNEVAFWSPLPRQYNIYRASQAGMLEGITLPAQRNLKVTPYALGKANQGTGVSGTDTDTEFGVDLKYSVTPSLTLDATYNTDFAQVEVDETVVNLDRFNIFLPEKPPFFLENAGHFSVGLPQEVELFFSRRIGIGADGSQIPIDGGLRLSGKVGQNTNVGLLQMRSQSIDDVAPRNDYSVVRVNQELKNRSSFGGIFVQRDGDGSLPGVSGSDDYNRTYGLDGRWGIGDDILISSFVAKTDTENRDGKDHALSLRGEYNSQDWSNAIGYSEVGNDFNPEVGFVSRRDYRKADLRIFRRYRPENFLGLQEIRPHVAYRGYWDFDGLYESGFTHVDSHWEFKNGNEVHTGVNFIHETVTTPFDIVDGVTVMPGDYDTAELHWVAFTNRGAPLSVELETKIGGYFSGDKVTLQPAIHYRIGDAFNSSIAWNYNDIDLDQPNGKVKINVGILRLAYSFTPKISLEALVQYDDRDDSVATNIRFAWLHTANAGLYLVYNELNEDLVGQRWKNREFILKYSYIFDLLN